MEERLRPHLRPDDPGRAFGQTEYHRGEPGVRHLKGNGKETEIKLTNAARASLEELLGDYRDFPRLRGGIAEWPPGHSHSRRLRQLETAFVREGGLRERMTRARLTERKVRAQGNSS